MNMIKHSLIVLTACCAASPAFAADFDGSKSLICATVEARDCVLGSGCFGGNARDVGAPGFMRLDFDDKVIKGPERNTPITSMVTSKNQLLMQGTELGYGWAFAINQTNGDFSASLTNIDGTFLLFGACTLD